MGASGVGNELCAEDEPVVEVEEPCSDIQKVFMPRWWGRKKHARGGSVARGVPRLSTAAQVQVQ